MSLSIWAKIFTTFPYTITISQRLVGLFYILCGPHTCTDGPTRPRNPRVSPDSTSYLSQTSDKAISPKAETSKRALISSPLDSSTEDDFTIVRQPESSPGVLSAQLGRNPCKKKRAYSSTTSDDQASSFTGTRKGSESASPVGKLLSMDGTLNPSGVRRLSYDLNHDPRYFHPELTGKYIDTYFNHINILNLELIPQGLFLRWLEQQRILAERSKMVVYAMMALGSLWLAKSNAGICETFAKIARLGSEKYHSDNSLQVLHTRLLLALFCSAIGDQQLASSFIGHAFRSISALGWNHEERCEEVDSSIENEYGLNRHGQIECRRRTFWSAYILDVRQSLFLVSMK